MSTAAAQSPLEVAEALYEQGALSDAIRAYENALANGPHSVEALASAYRNLGILSTITGALPEASAAFARALALDPNVPIPEELNPGQRTTFLALQRDAQQIEMVLHPSDVSETRSTQIRVELQHAPNGFAATLRVSAAPHGAPPWRTEAAATDGIEIPTAAWRGSRELMVEVEALDSFGNVITSATTTLRTQEPAPQPLGPLTEEVEEVDPITQPSESRSVARSPWLWTGVAAVVLGGVLTAVLMSQRGERYEGGTIAITRDPR